MKVLSAAARGDGAQLEILLAVPQALVLEWPAPEQRGGA